MSYIKLQNANLVLPGGRCQKGSITLAEGRIQKVAPGGAAAGGNGGGERWDLEGAYVAPGYIDIHIHGAGGYWAFSDKPEDILSMARFLPRAGVTSFLPTTVSLPHEQLVVLMKSIDAAARKAEAALEKGADSDADGLTARFQGVHAEGPYISKKKPGAHNVSFIRPVDLGEIDELIEASGKRIRLMTLAPEAEGAVAAIGALKERGVFASMGHTNATADEARLCIAAGARSATHLLNAMRPINQRDPGVAVEALLEPALFVEMIADGYHLSPEIVKMIVRLKQEDRLTLVSDALAAAGQGDCEFSMGGYGLTVKDGRAIVTGTDIVAGAVTLLDRSVKNVCDFAGEPIERACRYAGENPAALLGIDGEFGSIEEGKKADLVVLDPDCRVMATFIDGRAAYRRA